jgi:6-pyruvoyltetrahydropterin/6-carboxytetrahydropterin synthase
MYTASKDFTFEAAHALANAENSPHCQRTHGHSYKVTLILTVDELNGDDMVLDFSVLSQRFKPVQVMLDHSFIEEALLESFGVVEPVNTTAENIAVGIWLYMVDQLKDHIEKSHDNIKRFRFFEVVVRETEKCAASYKAPFYLESQTKR